MSARVRPATEADLPALAALEGESFSAGASEELLERLLRDGRHVFLTAEEDGRLAGYLWYEYVLDEGDIGNVAVLPELRRRGIGRALMRAAMEDAAGRGLVSLTLEVRESNAPARRLYETLGFREIARRKGYYEKPREDAVLMTAAL